MFQRHLLVKDYLLDKETIFHFLFFSPYPSNFILKHGLLLLLPLPSKRHEILEAIDILLKFYIYICIVCMYRTSLDLQNQIS